TSTKNRLPQASSNLINGNLRHETNGTNTAHFIVGSPRKREMGCSFSLPHLKGVFWVRMSDETPGDILWVNPAKSSGISAIPQPKSHKSS
ncbi:MAG: hypothetical protein ACPGPS_20895, partial [Rubripirellula sp.]